MTLEALLTVQERRIDRAMSELRSRNDALRRALAERATRRDRWQETEDGRRLELSRRVEMTRHSLLAVQLAAAGKRLEWWRARSEEHRKELEAAEAALLQAEAEAARARMEYEKAHAKHTGLLKLLDEERRIEARTRERIEEHNGVGG
jgi:chromosome segregation ATPase